MNIFSALLILAALVTAHLSGWEACVRALHKYYPATFRVLRAELREKQAAGDATKGKREGA